MWICLSICFIFNADFVETKAPVRRKAAPEFQFIFARAFISFVVVLHLLPCSTDF